MILNFLSIICSHIFINYFIRYLILFNNLCSQQNIILTIYHPWWEWVLRYRVLHCYFTEATSCPLNLLSLFLRTTNIFITNGYFFLLFDLFIMWCYRVNHWTMSRRPSYRTVLNLSRPTAYKVRSEHNWNRNSTFGLFNMCNSDATAKYSVLSLCVLLM